MSIVLKHSSGHLRCAENDDSISAEYNGMYSRSARPTLFQHPLNVKYQLHAERRACFCIIFQLTLSTTNWSACHAGFGDCAEAIITRAKSICLCRDILLHIGEAPPPPPPPTNSPAGCCSEFESLGNKTLDLIYHKLTPSWKALVLLLLSNLSSLVTPWQRRRLPNLLAPVPENSLLVYR